MFVDVAKRSNIGCQTFEFCFSNHLWTFGTSQNTAWKALINSLTQTKNIWRTMFHNVTKMAKHFAGQGNFKCLTKCVWSFGKGPFSEHKSQRDAPYHILFNFFPIAARKLQFNKVLFDRENDPDNIEKSRDGDQADGIALKYFFEIILFLLSPWGGRGYLMLAIRQSGIS